MIDHRIRLHGLRAFAAAAGHMNFTRAAEELGVSQSAVSHQIQRLEDHLGTQLFHRRHRKLALTEAGHVLLSEVQKGFSHFTRGLDDLEALKKSGAVRVNVTPRFALKWLVPRLNDFSLRFPAIKLKYHQSTEATDFSASDADVSIEWHFVEPPDHKCHLLLSGRFAPVCAPDLVTGPNPLRTPSDLRNHTVLFERDGRTWSKWFEVAGCPDLVPAKSVVIDDGNIRVQAAMDGQGIELGSLELLVDELASGRLIQPFDAVFEGGGYYLVYPAETFNRPRPRLFIEWLLGEAA